MIATPDVTPAGTAEHGGALAPVVCRGLSFSYPRRPPVLSDIDLTLAPGSLTMVLGASGGGKTTLLKLLRGLLAPTAGSLSVLATPRALQPAKPTLTAGVAYIPQQLGLVRGRSALDNALMGALPRISLWRGLCGRFPGAERERAELLLSQLGLSEKTAEPVSRLSGGERQRVAIARALMQHAQLLLADEFVSQLDPATTDDIMAATRRIVDSGVTVVMTTHEPGLIAAWADRVLVLRAGRLVLDEAGAGVSTARIRAAIQP